MRHRHLSLLFALFLNAAVTACTSLQAHDLYAVQIPVDSILNCRPVSTLSGNQLTTWDIGIDGNGNADGYLTTAASLFVGDQAPHALPDSAWIAANSQHPQVQLHYSNEDSRQMQARCVRDAGEFTVAVPEAGYSKVYLFLTSAEGASDLQVQMIYTDAVETKEIVLPDYYADIPATIPADEPLQLSLLGNLAKWDKNNKMTEFDHHNINGIALKTNAAKTLTSIKIAKAKRGYLVFWGATGIPSKAE